MIEPSEIGTKVTVRCADIPAGIDPEDHAVGLASSLANLAKFTESKENDYAGHCVDADQAIHQSMLAYRRSRHQALIDINATASSQKQTWLQSAQHFRDHGIGTSFVVPTQEVCLANLHRLSIHKVTQHLLPVDTKR